MLGLYINCDRTACGQQHVPDSKIINSYINRIYSLCRSIKYVTIMGMTAGNNMILQRLLAEQPLLEYIKIEDVTGLFSGFSILVEVLLHCKNL